MIFRINGYLMSGDDAIAEIKDGHIISTQQERMPYYLQRYDDLYGWLEKRAVDKHRTNSRLLKRLARLSSAEDPDVSMHVYASTITDNYWVKPDGCNLTYSEIRFCDNLLAKTALYGDRTPFSDGTWRQQVLSPEFTNIGSFEKCWVKEDGIWWMYKSGNIDAQYAELFMSKLGMALNIPVAEYKYSKGYVKSRDITENAKYNLDLASGLVLDKSEDYGLNYDVFCQISPDIAKAYVTMLYFDALCRNVDRHTENYGILRDSKTGKAICFAPLFDHNLALLVQESGSERYLSSSDILVSDFLNFVRERGIAFDQPVIDESALWRIAASVPIAYDTEAVVHFVMARQEEMQRELSLCRGCTYHIAQEKPSVLKSLHEKQSGIARQGKDSPAVAKEKPKRDDPDGR